MRKTYATPALTLSGNVIGETLGAGVLTPQEFGSAYKPINSGSLGFHL
jgi:hypothetical protein